jgi:phosphopantetheine adenylyltransferase
VKEIFLLGGSVEGIVPSVVEDFLNKKKKKAG